MADYTQPEYVDKRVRFFDGQYLQDQDFVDEQKYHLDRHRRLSRLLRVTGVAEGLTVAASGANQVTVAKGMAVDSLGRQLVLAADLVLRLPAGQFNNQQKVAVRIIYEAIETDVATTGSKSERRFSERPKVAAVGTGSALAVAPEGASTKWDGPTVLLARVNVDGNGAVTVDATAAERAGVGLMGKIQLDGTQQLVFADGDTTNNLKLQLWTGYGLGINGGTLFYAANGRHSWRDNAGTNERMALTTGADGALTVSGTGASSFAGSLGVGKTGAVARLDVQQSARSGTHPTAVKGLYVTGDFGERSDGVEFRHSNGTQGIGFGYNTIYATGTNADQHLNLIPRGTGGVGIGTVSPGAKLTVSAGSQQLQLRREATDTAGGAQQFLELYQDEYSPPRNADVWPGIRFRHHNHFESTLEARPGGLVVMTEGRSANKYGDLTARRLSTKSTEGTAGGWYEAIRLDQASHAAITHPGGGLLFGLHGDRNFYWGDAKDGTLQKYVMQLNADSGRLYVQGSGQLVFMDGDTTNNLKLQLWSGYGLGINGGTLFYAANGRHSWRDNAGTNERMALTTGADGGLTVSGTGTSSFAGPLSVAAQSVHQTLVRDASQTTGGNVLFLELIQVDPQNKIPTVHPSIRFHHNNKFWHRIEGRPDGLHVKEGNVAGDGYSDIKVRNIFVTDRLFLEPKSNWGTEPGMSMRIEDGRPVPDRRYWYFYRDRWNLNNLSNGGVIMAVSEHPFPSDVRLKEHVSDITGALDRIGRLRGVEFDWNATGLRHLTRDIEQTATIGPDATDEENAELWEELREERYPRLAVRNIGLIAQDVEQVAPELVHTDDGGFKTVDYSRLAAVLVEAIKELDAKLSRLER